MHFVFKQNYLKFKKRTQQTALACELRNSFILSENPKQAEKVAYTGKNDFFGA